MLKRILNNISEMSQTVVDIQDRLVSIPALGPDNGGQGEVEKAEYLKEYLRSISITDIRDFNAPDDSVSCGYRPNVVAVIPGKNKDKTLWTIGHLDVVPPGDLSLWNTDPYELVRDGDLIYGRGVEDNHQGMVSSILAAKAFIELGIEPDVNYGLIFVADEETGSKYGLDFLVREHEDIFSKQDMFLVPDFGDKTSSMVEIAEKSMFWLKVEVTGKQCHASTPGQGVNSFVASSALVLRIHDLYKEFAGTNPLFDPEISTFEPTKKEANVENVNTIPGRDVFYVDCRVLPQYDLDDIFARIQEYGAEVEKEYKVTVAFDFVMKEQAAPATPVDSELVVKISEAIKDIYPVEPKPVGIGGGTVAAFLRRKGYHAVVWSTLMHNAHQPNEVSSISYTINDAKVIAKVLLA